MGSSPLAGGEKIPIAAKLQTTFYVKWTSSPCVYYIKLHGPIGLLGPQIRGSQPCPHAKIVGRRDFFGKITTKFSKKIFTAVKNIQNIIKLKQIFGSDVFEIFLW